jgi:endonuclease/exonuclease/phosphatase (EEP) superfamily protein YafD
MEYADGQNRLAAMKDWMWHGNVNAPQRDDSKTYSGFRDNPATWTTIDHIFYRNAVNKGYKVVDDETKYGVRFISDHFPIYVDFEM